MPYQLILALLFSAPGFSHAAVQKPDPSAGAVPYVERDQKEFPFYPGGKIECAAAVPGGITIEGWDKAAVLVETEKIFYYQAPDRGAELSAEYPVHVTWTNTSARITTAGPSEGSGVEINLRVRVPKVKTDLDIRLAKGDLLVSNTSGWIEATLEAGSIEARGLNGYFSGLTRLGDLTVELSGKRWTGYGFAAATERGSGQLVVPAGYSATIQLETRDGDISIRYPDQLVEGELVPLAVQTRKKTRSLSGIIGAGGSAIRMKTKAGNLILETTPKP